MHCTRSIVLLLAGTLLITNSSSHSNLSPSNITGDVANTDNFTLINETPLIQSNSTHVPAIVLFESFIFEKFNISDVEVRASNDTKTVNSVQYVTRFIQDNLNNLYRNLNALNRFITESKYSGNETISTM